MAVELFVDTSAWFALADRGAADHRSVERALRARVRSGARIVTTNLIVAETHVLLLRRASRAAALAFVREVGNAPNVVVTSTPELEARALRDWLGSYTDQAFSFTDAVSFSVLSERGIRDSLTLDRHFAVAGFVMVP